MADSSAVESSEDDGKLMVLAGESSPEDVLTVGLSFMANKRR